jgi:hypothetical protein
LKTIAPDDDTLSAISYALWELAFDGADPERPDVVDFLLELMSHSSCPSVHNYAALMLEDYVAAWPVWANNQYDKLVQLSHTTPVGQARALLKEIAKKVLSKK